jgi:hypothetical protein
VFDEEVHIDFTENTKMFEKIHIVRSNGPVEVERNELSLILNLGAQGMQEVKIYSPEPLVIRGVSLKIKQEENVYTVTRFGDAASIEVFLKN